MSQGLRDDIAYLGGIAAGLLIILAFGFVDFRASLVGVNDFSYIWAGARTIVEGGDPYDPAAWLATTAAHRTAVPNEPVYGYPPWVAIALTPLGALPLPLASNLWTAGGMALAALGLRALLRSSAAGLPLVHSLAGLALFASQPGIATFWSGQWSFVLVGALAACASALQARARIRALAALGLLGKPQLFLLALPSLARAALTRHGLLFAAFLVVPLLLVVAVAWLLLPDWYETWRSYLIPMRMAFPPPPTTLAQAFVDLMGSAGAYVAALTVLAAVFLGLMFNPRGDEWLAVWLGISMITPLYAWSYDHLVLVVPLVLAAGALGRRAPRAALIFAAGAFVFFLIAPMLLYVIATIRQRESFNAFVPLALLALSIAALWPQRHGTSAPIQERGQTQPSR
jgi:hypothetical protein